MGRLGAAGHRHLVQRGESSSAGSNSSRRPCCDSRSVPLANQGGPPQGVVSLALASYNQLALATSH